MNRVTQGGGGGEGGRGEGLVFSLIDDLGREDAESNPLLLFLTSGPLSTRTAAHITDLREDCGSCDPES